MTRLGWWAIEGEVLLAALRRCAAGEDPDMVYAEMYANSDTVRAEGSGGDE